MTSLRYDGPAPADDLLLLGAPEPAADDPGLDPGLDAGFDVVLRGYDRRQVDAAVDVLHERIGVLEAAAAAERAAHARVERRLASVESSLVAAQRERDEARAAAVPAEPSYAALGARIEAMLTLAAEEAAGLRAAAELAAAPALASAREQAERIRAEAERQAAAVREQAALQTELAAQQAEQVQTAAEEQAEALIADGRRRQREAALAADTERRRAESEALAVRAATRTETEQALSAASREAGETRRAAREEAERLTAQRDAVLAEMARLRDTLDTSV